ncbi:MAG: hypothetical protein NWP98_11225 [Erythrobacter sp.]|nr:hypothetical protein [Erythrobacter sp.]
MSRIVHSLVWAGSILAAAAASSTAGLSDDASSALFIGLSGAAWVSLYGGGHCGKFAGCAR